MSAIKPNKAQFLELMEAPDEGPVTMLNLLKFKAAAGDMGQHFPSSDDRWKGAKSTVFLEEVKRAGIPLSLLNVEQGGLENAFLELVSEKDAS